MKWRVVRLIPVAVILLVIIVVSFTHFPQHRPPDPPKAPPKALPAAPRGVMEIDTQHYYIKHGYEANAWHLCQHGAKQINYIDTSGYTHGAVALKGGDIVACNQPNDHYLFRVPKGK